MSLKRMPSVGKSLMSRILARSPATSMGGILQHGGLPLSLQLREGLGQAGEAGDGGVGPLGAEGLERGAGDLDRAETRVARAEHVEDRVVADADGRARPPPP